MDFSRIMENGKPAFLGRKKYKFSNHEKNKSSITLHAKEKLPFTRHENSIRDPVPILLKPVVDDERDGCHPFQIR